MVVDSLLPHAKCGPNDHRKDAPPFSSARKNIFRLYLFNEAEMRRSRLVERANTEDEDEELDSWGSDTDSEVDPKEDNPEDNPEDNLQDKSEKSEDKKSSSEDIGPDGPEDKSKMTS